MTTRIQQQIADQVAEIRAHALKWDLPEKNDPLRIVPFVSQRCMVSCGPGRCNCWPTVGHHFCIVFESHLKRCSQDFLSEMGYLQQQVESASRNCELISDEQASTIDQTHLALNLSK